MLILEQTLFDLGYHESAKLLQMQSGVDFYSKQLQSLKYYLDANDFISAINMIEGLLAETGSDNRKYIRTQALKIAQDMIFQTYCLQKIHFQDYDGAINIMNEHINNEERKQKICEALVFGNFAFLQIDFQKKKADIFKFCLQEYQQIGEKQIQKMIECYSQSQGDSNKQIKNLRSMYNKFPSMRILSRECEDIIKGNVTQIRINEIHDLVLIATQNKQTQSILLFKIHRKNLSYRKQIADYGTLSFKQKYPIFMFIREKTLDLTFKNRRQSVESIAWSNSKESPILAVSTFSIIQLYNTHFQLIKRIQSQNKIEKTLHVSFNPITDLFYTCGYYEYMNMYDQSGDIFLSIHPFPKVRKFIFFKTQILSISLVSNKIFKHSLDEQTLICQKQLDVGALPMDICCSLDQKVAVSSLMYVYIVNVKNLQILGKTSSPLNPSQDSIQLSFYGQYLISLCRNFNAYELINDKSNNKTILNKIKQWPGEGTFSISQSQILFIKGLKQLTILQEGNTEMDLEKGQNSQQEQLQQEQSLIDVENILSNQQDEEDQQSDPQDPYDSDQNMSGEDNDDEDEEQVQI